MGRQYLNKLVAEYPDGTFAKQAQEELRALEASVTKQ